MKTKLLLATLPLLWAVTLSAQEAKYEIKSAVITKTVEMMGQKMEGIQYFDDYGKKESVLIKMPMPGTPDTYLQIRIITKGDTIISVNLTNKTGNKMVLPEKPVNYLKMTPEIKEKYKVKELGQEEVIGKPCSKYSLEVNQMGQTASITVWIWKGIALKTITNGGGMTMSETATEIKESATVDAEVFSIPEGITVQGM